MGEPGGVGLEITIKAWRAFANLSRSAPHAEEAPEFFLIDDPARVKAAGAPVAIIEAPSEALSVFSDCLPVFPLPAAVSAIPGRAAPETAQSVITSIEKAVEFALSGAVDGVVTNPIQKSVLRDAGFPFPGHTEFLAALTEDAPMPSNRPRGPVMLLAGPRLKTAPVTIHVSVKEAAQSLKTDEIIRQGMIIADALQHDFGITSPRLAISGLNPHAGENGAMGDEDNRIIAPAVKALCSAGIDARGPLPADTMFHERALASYDAALCMLHDQALIPVKTLDFDRAVNVTLGLPIVRTSPDHGTALDIAGKDMARPDSLMAALRLASFMAQQRRGRP